MMMIIKPLPIEMPIDIPIYIPINIPIDIPSDIPIDTPLIYHLICQLMYQDLTKSQKHQFVSDSRTWIREMLAHLKTLLATGKWFSRPR